MRDKKKKNKKNNFSSIAGDDIEIIDDEELLSGSLNDEGVDDSDVEEEYEESEVEPDDDQADDKDGSGGQDPAGGERAEGLTQRGRDICSHKTTPFPETAVRTASARLQPPDGDPHRDQDLQNQNSRDPVAEGSVQRLVVKDPHAQQRADTAAQDGEQEQRFLRHPADGLVADLPAGLPFVQAEHQEGHKIDEDQPDPQQCPGIADHRKERGGLFRRQIERLFHMGAPNS